MGEPLRRERNPKLLVALLFIVVVAFVPSFVIAQRTGGKLSKQDIIDLLTGDAPSDEVTAAARKSGISFQMTAAAEKDIRAAGGNDELIRALRALSPAPPAQPATTPTAPSSVNPAVLLIESNPGQSQVYVDDEPKGSTSQAGRLKLTQIAPGEHRVRISLSGYQDYEQTVTLTAGAGTTVSATLQKPAIAQISAPPQSPETTTPPPVQLPPQVQTPAQPNPNPTLMPRTGVQNFIVAHDHGQGGQQYCVGIMSIGNGVISYKGMKGTNGVHSFDIPLNSVKKAGRNGVYLIAYMAFHIQTKRGTNFNFAVMNQQGHFEPPDAILTAIDNAMGR